MVSDDVPGGYSGVLRAPLSWIACSLVAIAKVFETKREAYMLHKQSLHKQSMKQSAAGSQVTFPTVNQQAYWNHVSKYLKEEGGRGGIKAAADSWADSRSESAAEQKAKGKAAKAKAKAKAESKSAKAKAESKSAKAKAKATAAKQQEPNAKAEEKQAKIGVTKTIQDKEKAKKAQKVTAKEKADKANAGTEKKMWAAFRASADK